MADVVEAWLFEYACYHREYKVIKEISKRHVEVVNISDYFDVPHIRLATAVLHHAVDKNVIELFPLALEFVDEICELLDSLLPFQVYAKLSCGIKMQILLYVLQQGQTVTALAKLNEYFPRMGIRNFNASSKELSRLNKHISNFRKFFLPLIANEKQRNYYFANEYEEEYGESYLLGLQKSAYKFVNKVDELLPKPKIQKILDKGAQYFNGFSSSEIAYEILLDYCVNQTSLSCDDMLDILTSISPLYTQDIVYTEHNDSTLSCSNSSDLLIPSNKAVLTSVITSAQNSASEGTSFTQIKESCEGNQTKPIVDDDNGVGGFKRNFQDIFPLVDERKQYKFKRGKELQVHHLGEHKVNIESSSENVTELVQIPFRHTLNDDDDHELFTRNDLQTASSSTEYDLLIHTSLEMVEKEVIEEGLLSKDDNNTDDDKTDDDSITNIDDIPITSDEDNQVIQSSVCLESTDSEDMLHDLSKSIQEQRKYRGFNPEIKLIYETNLSDDEDTVYKIFN